MEAKSSIVRSEQEGDRNPGRKSGGVNGEGSYLQDMVRHMLWRGPKREEIVE